MGGGSGSVNSNLVIPEYKYRGPPRKEINDPMISNNERKINGKRYYEENNPDNKSNYNNKDRGNNKARKFVKTQSYDRAETYVQKPGDPIIDLKLYNPRPPPRKYKEGEYPHPAKFYPNIVQNPMNPVSYARNYNNERFGGPTFKKIDINIGGVSNNHVKTSLFFEDVLPVADVQSSFKSTGERITLYEYIRTIMFPHGDGVDRPIDDKNYNLLSHIKFMDMNPYNASRLSNNPYRGLPYGFLLYRSCYPIKKDDRSASAVCARDSTGVNVRIYRLTEGAYNINNGGTGKVTNYDQWREMIFYDYVKDHIVREKKCPNFPIMYGYNITINSNINFDDVNDLNKTKNLNGNNITIYKAPINRKVITNAPITTQPNSKIENAIINAITDNVVTSENPHISSSGHVIGDINPIVSPSNLLIKEYDDEPNTLRRTYTNDVATGNRVISIDTDSLTVMTPVNEYITSIMPDFGAPVLGTVEMHKVSKDADTREYKTVFDIDCNDKVNVEETQKMIEDLTYAGKVVVALTEAPNYNIIEWTRKKYRSEGNVQTMIDTGFRAKHVWESIIFQMMAGIYALQKSGIAIRDFCLERNVFIKDIQNRGKTTNYWKYRIDGIDYFVPNYGYIVLIDSNYRDFDNDVENKEEANETRARKLVGKIFGDDITKSENDIDTLSRKSLKCSVNRDTFGRDFINTNGMPPPKEILDLLANITADIDTSNDNNVGYYIRKHMTMFINNRVGTLLQDIEVTNVMKGAAKDFKNGEIVVMNDKEGRERFVIHVNTNDSVSTIITRNGSANDGEFIENRVPVSSLIKYSLVSPIEQNYNSIGSNMGEDSILDTYNL